MVAGRLYPSREPRATMRKRDEKAKLPPQTVKLELSLIPDLDGRSPHEFADPARAMTAQKIAELRRGSAPAGAGRAKSAVPSPTRRCAGRKKLDAVLRACDARPCRRSAGRSRRTRRERRRAAPTGFTAGPESPPPPPPSSGRRRVTVDRDSAHRVDRARARGRRPRRRRSRSPRRRPRSARASPAPAGRSRAAALDQGARLVAGRCRSRCSPISTFGHETFSSTAATAGSAPSRRDRRRRTRRATSRRR